MICLDSDCIIDYLKGRREAVDIVRKHEEEAVTTEISAFEVFFGVYSKKEFSEKEKIITKEFFDSIPVLPFDNDCGEISAKAMAVLSRRGMGVEQNDCLIASIILKNGFNHVITRNKKHFSRFKDLKVVSY